MQVGNLDDYFAFKLPETDQRKNSLHLTGTGQKNHIAQALSNEANVRNDACMYMLKFTTCIENSIIVFLGLGGLCTAANSKKKIQERL